MTHIARKRFGQNFLHDHSIIHAIVQHINPQSGQHLVEIGPGQGALTQPLLQHSVQLDLIELDRDLVNLLGRQFDAFPQLRLHSADALRFDFSRLVHSDEKLRIIGNLPYNISTPLLFHLLEFAPYIDDMHFMLQKEVVERICAPVGSEHYGRLSIMMQYHCAAELLFVVPPESFHPIPKVMSAVVRIVPHRQAPVEVADLRCLSRVVADAFSQRRKTLRNALKKCINEETLLSLGVDPKQRAETISLAQYARLSNYLAQQNTLDSTQ